MGAQRRYGKGLAISAGLAAVGAAAFGSWMLSASAPSEAETGSFVRHGEAGFVFTKLAYALGPDAGESSACPEGLSQNVTEIFGASAEGQRRPGEGDGEYSKRLDVGGQRISVNADGQNYCVHPELAPKDTHFRTLDSLSVRADGLDLDGTASTGASAAKRRLADFTGLDGKRGVDNQFYRAVGCSRSFRSDGLSNSFGTEMYTGSWGILLRLRGVDDLENDDHVEVGIYANADPMQLSPTRKALEYATYAMEQTERFRASTTGRIHHGMLTTDPFDMRFYTVVNSMVVDRPIRDARVSATLSKDGVLKGYLAGFVPIEKLYDYQFGFRDAKTASGKPAPMGLRLGSANGAARVLGYTCQGMYQALQRFADAYPDPRTGKFTAISTQYTFEARPAFVVDVETKSANEKLVRND